MQKLSQFGWTDKNQQDWNTLNLSELHPARVIADFGTSLKLATPEIITGELSGKLAHYSSRDAAPKVGDWVAVRVSDNGSATVESIVLRANEIARKVAGKQTEKQVIAANVDIAFVLLALDNDFSVERLKRFLFQLSVNSIEAIIVLNKADKTNDVQSYIDQLKDFNIPVLITIAKEGKGMDEVAAHIRPGKTAILLGSSGVGKSTMTNKLLGREAQRTNEIRESDSTGKHTTVHRELFILPNGGILVDTPGIRELQLWGTEEELGLNFDDITAIASRCKYTTCTHVDEEGCAVREALANGTLDKKHYRDYLKMKSELVKLAEKTVVKTRLQNARPRFRNKTKSAQRYNYSKDND